MDNTHHSTQPAYYPKKKNSELGRPSNIYPKESCIAPAIAAVLLYAKPL